MEEYVMAIQKKLQAYMTSVLRLKLFLPVGRMKKIGRNGRFMSTIRKKEAAPLAMSSRWQAVLY